MSDVLMAIVITVATMGVAALTVVLALSGQRKRREEFRSQAGLMAARFEPRPGHGFVFDLRERFWIFRSVRSNTVSNLIETTSGGASFRLFEYAYWRFASRTPTLVTVLLITSPGMDLPALTMGDDGGPLRLRDTIVAEPVGFENEAFTRTHVVHADDPETAAAAFPPDLQEYLAQRPSLALEAGGDSVVLYEPGRRLEPSRMKDRLEEGATILRSFAAQASGTH